MRPLGIIAHAIVDSYRMSRSLAIPFCLLNNRTSLQRMSGQKSSLLIFFAFADEYEVVANRRAVDRKFHFDVLEVIAQDSCVAAPAIEHH